GERDIVNQQQLEGVPAGSRGEDLQVRPSQQGRQRQQVFLQVINEQTLH
ncbi:hypothetical protein OY671_012480, partial [Metschnikowia pulcherrima]